MSSKAKSTNQNIQVFVRVRPSNASEQKSRSIVDLKSDREISVKDPKQSNTFKTFAFNNVFGPNSAQVDVYRSVVQPLIDEVLSGYNCTVFAYGQTGTGKTFTMEGERSTDANVTWEKDPLAGIVPRTLSQLFDELRLLQVDFSVKVSFLELYNEELFDLLSSSDDMTKLRIFEDSSKKGAVIVSGLEEVSVHSKADVYNIMKKGSDKRRTASTLMNARSSRSHTVFTVTVHIKESANEGEEVMRTGKMNLVDLAGSENIGRSGAVDKRAREAGNINQSLLTLGRVITALVDRSPHVPYRESKLTRILQESLGGRTKTSIIATVSPAACNLEETLSTLDYAHRAKNILNKPEINQRLCKKTMLKEYSEEIERLQRDLEATRQRTGVYLDQSEYDNMMLNLEQLAEEIKEKEEELVVSTEEMEKKKAICEELGNRTQEVQATVKERTAIRDEQVSTLSKLRAETSQITTDISEKDYLMLCHMDTLQVLSSQANTLHKSTIESTENVGLLYDKIDRTRSACQRNESSIEEFAEKNIEITDGTKAVIKESMKSLSNAVCGLESLSAQNLNLMGTHLRNIESAAEGFSKVQEQTSAICEKINEVVNEEPVLKAEIDVLQTCYEESHVTFEDLNKELLATTNKMKEVLSVDFGIITDLHLQINMECDVPRDILNDWTSTEPLSDMTLSFANEVESSMKIIDRGSSDDEAFSQKHLEKQQVCEEKFKAISRLLEEIVSVGGDMISTADAHGRSVKESVNTAMTKMEEAKDIVRSAVTEEKTKLDSVLSEVHQHFDGVSHISHKLLDLNCLKSDFNTELLPLQTVSQHGQKIIMASESFKNAVQEKLETSAKNCERLTQIHDAHGKQVLSLISTAKQGVEEHANKLLSTVESFNVDIQRETGVLKEMVQSFEDPLVKQSDEYQSALDRVQSLGAKPCTPTGKTPLRSDVRIPRDLPSTLPHERILSGLRSKYSIVSKLNLDDSPGIDSAYSDVDSDFNSSEMDLSANKENSLIERESSEKSFQSHLPKPRKPLANNN
ncbi:kinesin-like protein KIF11-A [Thrips palmi]|uniref:Kinesin-like protein KIF11-A n=1 Tax=Thrips palmi TaxID=161013 RepID=A0A6P8YPB7_THRPL|nr:kinesin-like protein KIF11-A [Thrips palmi]